MGARPSSFRKPGNGGFLNNVDGTILNYRFTDEFNGQPFVPGKVKDKRTNKVKDKFHSLYVVLTVQVDGAEEPVETHLFAGGYEDYIVSEDGHTLEPIVDDEGRTPNISADSTWGRFVGEMCENGFDENELPGDDEPIQYEAIIGRRVRFVQKEDEQATKRLGKRVSKKGGEFDRQYLGVETVYEGQAAVQTPAKKATTAAKVGATKSAARTNGSGKSAGVGDFAAETLQAIVKKAGGEMPKSKVSLQVLQALKTDPRREEVRKYLQNDDNLGAMAGILYDQETGTISLEG